MSGQEVKRILNAIDGDVKLKNQLKREKAEVYPEQNKAALFYQTTAHFMPARFLQLKKKIEKLSTEGVSVFVSQNSFADTLAKDAVLLEQCCKDFCFLQQPTILPFLTNAGVRAEEGKLFIDFENDTAREMFKTMALADELKQFLWDVYGMSLMILFSVKEGAQGSYVPSKDAEKVVEEAAVAAAPPKVVGQPAVKAGGEEEQQKPRKTSGRRKQMEDLPVSQVVDLTIGEKCIIDGEVVAAESVPIKDGEMTKHKFVVCDYTGSVTCFFIESKRYASRLELPPKGRWVRVEGKYDTDTFERENTIKVKDIGRSSHIKRKDDAAEKRVELHVHTQMSAQDAVTPARDIIARAAEWGHKAIAITDHGVVQAFPEAERAAKQHGIKVIYGVEGYLVDDTRPLYEGKDQCRFEDEFVVFDIETTGLSPLHCDITEIGAVRVVDGVIKDTFKTYVKPSAPIPPSIVSLTGITDAMVADAPLPEQALQEFHDFCGNAVLVAHNASFDTGFVFNIALRYHINFTNDVIDTLALCQLAYPKLKNHKLDTVAKHLRFSLAHHRALNDAECTARIMLECFKVFQKADAQDMGGVNTLANDSSYKHKRMHHVILLCKNKWGMRNLYKLISHSHVDYFYRKPRMPKSLIEEHREGLIIGSACEQGELYFALLDGARGKRLEEIASFYDYLEIQPTGNNEFLVREGRLNSREEIKEYNKKIVKLGEKLDKPVVATCDVHFLDPHGEYFRRIIMKVQGYSDVTQAPLYLRTTDEMLREFAYLGKEKAQEVVVENTNKIADMTEEFQLFQDDTAMPVLENAAEQITEMAYETAKEKYGDPLPEIVEARLKRELDSIVGHGFSVLYYSAHLLVKKSLEDGYLVGSRGSVGSSLAATMTGITEVNPLSPHYICPNCKHSDFDVDKEAYACGVDLPDKQCPECGTPYGKDGYDIPFEVFLGINADKVPDIDLNFSGEYQGVAHKYTEELFGKGHVFRAGTISAIQDRIAYGYVKKFMEETETVVNEAEMNRLVQGISGVKKTTGQHPGGMVIVPHDREVYEFTPVQRPADKQDAEFITTHFDFNSMHDILIKLDILGHDVPTIIRHLQDLTGIDPLEIPLDDKETMELYSTIKPLGIKPEQLFGIKTGTLGIPEFGTKFVRQMLTDTLPTTMGEIVRISGLSHGTDVWLGNAQELIKEGTCTLKEAICTRDDIMNYLVDKGVEKRTAFFIMEDVRKGKVAKKGFTEEQAQALEDAKIPGWFVNSCKKIKYMFPKAHAVAYVTMAFRIAYCKVHYKEAFYASYFTVRSGEFDASFVRGGLEDIRKNWHMIENKGNAATANEKNMATMLEVAGEMYLRGLHFLPVDLQQSDAVKFTIEPGGLRMPFQSVPGLGENAAKAIVEERGKSSFLSVEDLKKRTRLSASVLEEMGLMGTLVGLSQTNQLSLFDV
ncbi:PolC-type DNA polymerase III [Christensenellaceae bacterium OttesenSCG-928-K19]|nr:PolC-type DNA polymerase III [Christensenellaceae bacterium OttesenSCG-928-K19]